MSKSVLAAIAVAAAVAALNTGCMAPLLATRHQTPLGDGTCVPNYLPAVVAGVEALLSAASVSLATHCYGPADGECIGAATPSDKSRSIAGGFHIAIASAWGIAAIGDAVYAIRTPDVTPCHTNKNPD